MLLVNWLMSSWMWCVYVCGEYIEVCGEYIEVCGEYIEVCVEDSNSKRERERVA